MKESSGQLNQYAVGIDVALRSHTVAIINKDGAPVSKPFNITADVFGFEQLCLTLDQAGASSAVTRIGLESTGNLGDNLREWLTSKGYSVELLNPVQTHNYKKLNMLRQKTDGIDALAIAGMVQSRQGIPCFVPTPHLVGLRTLCRHRHHLLETRSNYLRRIKEICAVAWPELRGYTWSRQLAVLRRFPTAIHCHDADLEEVQRAMIAEGWRDASKTVAGEIHGKAINSQYSGVAWRERGLAMSGAVRFYDQCTLEIDALEKAIIEAADAAVDGNEIRSLLPLLQSIPGVGELSAALILSETGDPTRFKKADQLVSYAGFVPRLHQSGETNKPAHISRHGPAVLRKAIYLCAKQGIRYSPEIKTFYSRWLAQRSASKTGLKPAKSAALIKVSVKLLHIIHSLARNKATYNPARVLVEI